MRGLLATLLLLTSCGSSLPEPSSKTWHVLTSLPLFVGQGSMTDMINGKSDQSQLITRLQSGRKLLPLDTIDEAVIAKVDRILMVQPSAIPAREIVAFDAWVRRGGQAVIFADPDMLWDTGHRFGGVGTPPPSTLLDNLFSHWGLKLEGMRQAPRISSGKIVGENVALANPGIWKAIDPKTTCEIEGGGLVAQCKIGEGNVILVADADVADPALWKQANNDNAAALSKLLARLEP